MHEPKGSHPLSGQHPEARPRGSATQRPQNHAPRPRGLLSQKPTIRAHNSNNQEGTSGVPHRAGGDTDNASKLGAAHGDSNHQPDPIPHRAHTQGPNPRAQPRRGLRTTSQGPGDSPARNQQTKPTTVTIRNSGLSLGTTPNPHLDTPPMVPTALGPDPPPPVTAAGGPHAPSLHTHPDHNGNPAPRGCPPEPLGFRA